MSSAGLGLVAAIGGRCCEVAPTQMAPGLPTRAAVSHGSEAVLTNLAGVVAVSQLVNEKPPIHNARRAISPPQALLCVFLI
jgi:hypothetical protein